MNANSKMPAVAPDGQVYALVRIVNIAGRGCAQLVPGERWHTLLRTARARARLFPLRLDVKVALITPSAAVTEDVQ